MTTSPDNQNSAPQNGLPFALAAYIIWGFAPIFFKLLTQIMPIEVLAQRVIWSLPFCFLIMAIRGQIGEFRKAFANPKLLGLLVISATLIATNWLIYIYAMFNEHLLAASIGYYLNPLLNVVLATLFLKEKLNRLQAVAVAIAVIGVAILAAGALDSLWISLSLAFTFATYGLLRKIAPIGAVPGLGVETTLLLPVALIVAGYFVIAVPQTGFGDGWDINALLLAGGIVTTTPLLLFATAARRMSYVSLGFVQYLAPSIVFILGYFVYNEPLDRGSLACFILIWFSVTLFSYDAWRKMRANRLAAMPI